jgi:hypothetical protein
MIAVSKISFMTHAPIDANTKAARTDSRSQESTALLSFTAENVQFAGALFPQSTASRRVHELRALLCIVALTTAPFWTIYQDNYRQVRAIILAHMKSHAFSNPATQGGR